LVEKLEKEERIVDWDDGFTPSGCNGARGKMVIDQPRSRPGLVSVVENVVPGDLASELYESAVDAGVWGEYINLRDIDALLGIASPAVAAETKGKPIYRRYLAAAAVHAFFREKCAHEIASDWEEHVHGVSVWVIASGVGDSVRYHIDYAEMLRFQTNVMYPPMYGATLHLTPTSEMEGGAFYANKEGLDHYREFGYKCPLEKFAGDLDPTDDDGFDERGSDRCAGDNKTIESSSNNNNDGNGNGNGNGNNAPRGNSSNWIQIPYKYNQGTLCDGDLPHFSAPVRSIPDGLRRVIVGFNVCNHEVGPIAEAYPEHSARFNRFVKLSQTAGKFRGGLTVEAVKSNPKLAAFVKLLARKTKEQERLRQAQQQQQQEQESEPSSSNEHKQHE